MSALYAVRRGSLIVCLAESFWRVVPLLCNLSAMYNNDIGARSWYRRTGDGRLTCGCIAGDVSCPGAVVVRRAGAGSSKMASSLGLRPTTSCAGQR